MKKYLVSRKSWTVSLSGFVSQPVSKKDNNEDALSQRPIETAGPIEEPLKKSAKLVKDLGQESDSRVPREKKVRGGTVRHQFGQNCALRNIKKRECRREAFSSEANILWFFCRPSLVVGRFSLKVSKY